MLLVNEETVLQGMTYRLNFNLKMLWNGNKRGQNSGNKNLKRTIPITDYDKSEPGQCTIFQLFG